MRCLLVLAAAVLAFAGVAHAAPVPILTDKADDQAVERQPLAPTSNTFPQVDLRDVTGDLVGGTLDLAITTGAPVTATERVTVRFTVDRGPTSFANTTARGTPWTLVFENSSVTGVPGATANASGSTLHLKVPLRSISAVGGDRLGNLTLTASDRSEGSAPPPVTQDDATATDRAPDAASATFTVPRVPIQAGLQLRPQGGTLRVGASSEAVAGTSAKTPTGNATVVFELLVENTGTDLDQVTFTLPPRPAGFAVLNVNPQSLSLEAGRLAPVTVTAQLASFEPQTLAIPLKAASVRGGTAQVDLSITRDAVPVPPPQTRTPVPAALGFLTPLAEALHMDDALGAFAELALLLFLLLLAVAILFLVLFTVRSPYVSVSLSPKRAVVLPGGVAEFRLEVEPRKRRQVGNVRGVLHAAGAPFRAALAVGGSRSGLGEPLDLTMPADHPIAGTLRVQVPEGADEKDRQTVQLDVVPLAEDGTPLPSHRGHAKVEVQAAHAAKATTYASARDIQLAEVRHEPPSPRPGAPVSTTATIHNDGPVPATLRVVLQLDGSGVAEERVEVAPRGSRQVTLGWTAGPGRNQVKVQVFLA